ncbi:helix-turn-helix domain-containing protein [Chitinophaga cymbidii]|uniref:HTH araC/xylS-type domain-containing protein n=1 Tax=Chitinophaga cymbidii TaxID=1096750 RepID=A0A512RRH0_9BACT|nr:AraC family transcriptional regulator [Chitinophaga cymbidii]GEP98301.1 hypothetical protein CCY01nite_45610 [Chitinophaga cymbidii]
MKLDVFSLVVLLGALQALFFGIYLLFSRSPNKLQQRSLAIFILILSYNGFETLNWSSGLTSLVYVFSFFPFVLVFGLGPALYLYYRSFRSSDPVRHPRYYYLVIWVLLAFRAVLVVLWVMYAQSGRSLAGLIEIDNKYGMIAEPLSVASYVIYYILAAGVYRKLRRELAGDDASLVLRWLGTLLIVTGIFALVWLVTVFSPYVTGIWDGRQYYVIEVLLVIFIYWIGFAGYHRTKVIYVAQQKKTQSYFDNLSKDEIDGSLAALQKAMEQDKLYLDPDLNISALAAQTGINAKTLSSVLNQRLNKGFNEYVNAYRVEAVKSKILNPANSHLTITGIAFECGFNSQPTFQRAFKAATGMTPKEFQSKHR